MPDPLPIAVLISGSGSNLQALIDHRAHGSAYRIDLVLSDQEDAFGLERAAAAGIPTAIVRFGDHPDRTAFTDAICDAVEAAGTPLMVLAGFMRILAPTAIRRFPNAIVNVHPALLPAFPGAHAVPQAIEHGVKLTGVTVHFVDEEVDHGPIIAQEVVPVFENDDVDALHERIQAVEHRLLPEVVAAIGDGSVTVDGRIVSLDRTPEGATP